MSSMSHPVLSDLADPSRRRILLGLRSGPRSVTALVGCTGLKQPNVSNHLARLRERGIVKAQRCGRQVYYSLADPFVESLLATAAREIEEAPPACPHAAELDRCRRRLLDALLTQDERAAGDVIAECVSRQLPLDRLYVELIEPCMKRIGDAYEEGRLTIGEEHLATAIVERLMARAASFSVPQYPAERVVVVGCVPENWHTLGPRMVADVLISRGWQCAYLGANVPARTFAEVARAKKPAAVLLSCAAEQNVAAAADAVAALRALRLEPAQPHFAIGLGGAWIREHPDLAVKLGADFTARDASRLLAEIDGATAAFAIP